jgi:hypothetical protein
MMVSGKCFFGRMKRRKRNRKITNQGRREVARSQKTRKKENLREEESIKNKTFQ